MTRVWPALALAGFSCTAHAQQPDMRPATQPDMRPMADMRITYHTLVPNRGGAILQIQYWDISHHRLRIDLPASGTRTLVDLESGRVTVMQPAQRRAVVMPPSPRKAPSPTLTRSGESRVAGVDCTEWRDPKGDAVFCLSRDGALLRARAHGVTITQASEIARGEQPAALFAIPTDDSSRR